MAAWTGRSVVLVALLATLGGAARVRTSAHIQKDISTITSALGRARQRMRVRNEHPDVQVLSQEAQKVIDAKIAAAAAAQQAAMDALMGLGSAQVGVPSSVEGKDNNTHKRNTTLDYVNALHAANVAKQQAIDMKQDVVEMIEACQDIFDFAAAHQGIKKQAMVDKITHTENAEADWGDLLEEVKEAEMADLELLVAKIDAIKAAHKKVTDMDEEIGSGASEGITNAATLVYEFADQLEARQMELLKTQEFKEWPELMSAELKTEIDSHGAQGLTTAVEHLEAVVEEHRVTLQKAFDQMMVLGGSTKMSNKTAMDELVQLQFEVNVKKAKAEALQKAVEHCIELINAFFAEFAVYKEELPLKLAAATQNAAEIHDQKEELVAAADKAELLAASAIYEFYQVMWTRYSEADKAPSDDEDYATLKVSLKDKAVEVHIWTNDEFKYLCDYYGSCAAAHTELMKLLEENNQWCDKRDNDVMCTTMKNGRQPDGKLCKWIRLSNEEGKDYCEQNSPPTADLKYGKDHPDGPGLFY